MRIIFTVLYLLWLLSGKAQHTNNLALTPPMGWNSWNYFGKNNINEQLIREVIDAMASHHMQELGYNYIVVDGGWRDTKLGPNGELRANSQKFPGGMKALADYAHAKGFKFGLHTVPGSHDCGCDKVGGWGYEQVHIKQFIEWGIDFIKLDRCRFSLDPHPEDYPKKDSRWYNGWDKEGKNIKKAYSVWAALLKESGKQILFSASAYRFYDWYPRLTNMGRTTGDIRSIQTGGAVFDSENKKQNSVMAIADINNQYYRYARPGYWNDPDMLVTGEQGLTSNEQRAHFALWCIMSAPLILGNDPRHMKAEELEIITNKEAIAVNQDPSEQGRKIKQDGKSEIWAKKLKDGSFAVLLLNRDAGESKTISLSWADLNLTGKQVIKDIYQKKTIGTFKDSFSQAVDPHSSLFLVIRPDKS